MLMGSGFYCSVLKSVQMSEQVFWRYSLYDPVFTGSKVIFRCVDEGNPEVEHQVDDQGTGILSQKDLKERRIGTI